MSMIGRQTFKAIAIIACTIAPAQVSAQAFPVDNCQALRLYGSAYTSRLCKNLSFNNHNGMMVCELAQGNPDIHLTFQYQHGNPNPSPLHITVGVAAPAACQTHSALAGNWPPPAGAAGLVIAPAGNQPAGWVRGPLVCQQPPGQGGVNIQNYVDRLNAVGPVAAGAQSACVSAFNAAQAKGLNPGVAGNFIQACQALACP
jgi:hypothetical protein